MTENIRFLLKYLAIEIVHWISSIFYMCFLFKFNRELALLGMENDCWEVLTYRDGLAVNFFVIAVVLVFFGCWRVYYRLRRLIYSELELTETLLSGITIAITVGVIISIIFLISNPILKAIFTVGLIGSAYAGFKR